MRAEVTRLRKLQVITAALSEARLPVDVARVVAGEMAAVLGADQSVFAIASDAGNELVVVDHHGLQSVTTSALGRFQITDTLPLARAYREGTAIWIGSRDDMTVQLGYTPQYESATAAFVCLPLIVDGLRLGAIAFGFFAERTFDDADRALALDLALQAANALDRARLHESEQRARMRLEILVRFAHAVVASERLEDVFDAALDSICLAHGTRRASILVFDDAGVMRFRAWRGLSDTYRAAVDGHSPWTRDTVDPQPVLVGDAAEDPAMQAYLPVFRAEGIAALAFVPLVARGRLVGKFMVYYDRAHVFSRHETELAVAIGNHLGAAIDHYAALAALKETIRYHELFAGMLAHDLRNPLAAVMSAAQLLIQSAGRDDAPITKSLARILASGERMARMVDQLLDFTRTRLGGGIAIHARTAHLAELCKQATGELELANPSWRIETDVAGDLRGTWDSDRLLQLISNLVANAGHHGDGSAAIRVELDGTGSDAVRLHVHNAGAIPEALQPDLFEPFRRTETSRGLGLGLYIVRQIVLAHGGTIDVRSAPATGTAFDVVLPRHTT